MVWKGENSGVSEDLVSPETLTQKEQCAQQRHSKSDTQSRVVRNIL